MSIDALDVAFAGVVVTGIGVVVGYLGGRADRRHSRQLAHDEWRRIRRGDLYVDLLDYVYRMVAHVDHYSASQGKVAPSNDEARQMQARLTAYGSPEVAAAAMEVVRGSLAIYAARTAPSRPGETTVTMTDMSRAEVFERQHALEALISAELARLPSTKSAG